MGVAPALAAALDTEPPVRADGDGGWPWPMWSGPEDDDHCIAEYDGSNNLLRKTIYGPCIDEPICMIETTGSCADTYYYHYDALGSVVALSNSDGDMSQTYEYDVYGQVAASDPNHPNPFSFTGRRFDTETGLYYYRARYYNPALGRFLQTDPAGQGMNPYGYCGNNATNCVDPSGMIYYGILDNDHEVAVAGKLTFACFNDDDSMKWFHRFDNLDQLISWRKYIYYRSGTHWTTQTGGALANGNEDVFWAVQALIYLGYEWDYGSRIRMIEDADITVSPVDTSRGPVYDGIAKEVSWAPTALAGEETLFSGLSQKDRRNWHRSPSLVILAHELGHAYDDVTRGFQWRTRTNAAGNTLYQYPKGEELVREQIGIIQENQFRFAFFSKVPGYEWVRPRPSVGWSFTRPWYDSETSHLHSNTSWEAWPWYTIPLP